MPLWGSVDNAANSDIAATMQVNKATSSSNRTLLYGNTRVGQFFANKAVGQFGVDNNEVAASPQIPHAGWNLRTEGTGGRAGRIHYECLVASGSMSGDGNDDTLIPDYALLFRNQPASNSAQSGFVTISTGAYSRPAGASLSYVWQYNFGSGWANVANVTGAWVVFGNTVQANVAVANANTVRVMVSATGANSIISSNASVTLLP